MIFDALVLAGGRSARLGGEAKATLVYEDRTLLERTVDAAADARLRVVVGPSVAELVLPSGVLAARENPAFGGPAAAIAAGFDALGSAAAQRADHVLILACDMPAVADAVRALLGALTESANEQANGSANGPAQDGLVAIDESGHPQYLVGIYRSGALEAAIEGHRSSLRNLSVRALFSGLAVGTTPVPPRSTHDVDTWSDAAHYGITPAPAPENNGS